MAALAAALLVAACRGGPKVPPVEPTLDLAAIAADSLLIVAVSGDGGAGTTVWSVDPATGDSGLLWQIDPSQSASDWHVGDGAVVYRLSHPLREVRESLVTQDLGETARPITVTTTQAGDGILAGVAWEGHSGDRLYYAVVREREAPGATAATPASRREYIPDGWEIRRTEARAGPGRVVWRWATADTVGLVPRLLAVDSEGWRASIQVMDQGGGPSELWVVDLLSGAVRHRLAAGDIRGPVVASTSGEDVAFRVARDGGGRVQVLDLATGTVHDLGSALLSGRGPLWSWDANIVAWADSVPGGVGLRRQKVPVEKADAVSDRELALSQPGDEALALSPGGDLALVARRAAPAGLGTAEDTGTDGTRPGAADSASSPPMVLVVVRLADGAWAPLAWQPAGTVWRADWLDIGGIE